MKQFTFKFIEKRNLWFLISSIVILLGISFMGYQAIQSKAILNFGVDFSGGSTILLKIEELTSSKTPNAVIEDIRDTLIPFGLEKSTIIITQDKEILIKTTKMTDNTNSQIIDSLRKTHKNVDVLEIDFIGPAIGEELKKASFWIILSVTIALLLYITWRFEFTFGISALIALIHDTLVILSFTALLGIEVNIAYIAAFLTVLGYSINDTIVVFDRIRENMKTYRNQSSLIDIANLSLNQTLIRTINTSITTLIVIISLLIFGGTTIKSFCLILLIGILAGTYSSIFIASPTLVTFNPTNE